MSEGPSIAAILGGDKRDGLLGNQYTVHTVGAPTMPGILFVLQ